MRSAVRSVAVAVAGRRSARAAATIVSPAQRCFGAASVARPPAYKGAVAASQRRFFGATPARVGAANSGGASASSASSTRSTWRLALAGVGTVSIAASTLLGYAHADAAAAAAEKEKEKTQRTYRSRSRSGERRKIRRRENMKLFTGNANVELAQEVADCIGEWFWCHVFDLSG